MNRRKLLAAAIAPFVPRCLLAQAANCADNLGSITQGSGRYSIDTTCFSNAGWVAPVPPLAGTQLWTDRAFDYRSIQYPINNNVSWTHGGVDFVGSQHSASSRPDQQYTDASPVFAIGSGTIRTIERSAAATQNLSRIYVEHQALDGTSFIAAYLHVYARQELREGHVVSAGETLGTLRTYGSPVHLHFQIDTDLGQRRRGSYLAGSTQDPLTFLTAHPGSGAELEPVESKRRWYAAYMRNAIHLGIFSNADPTTGVVNDRAWRRANVPVPRGELLSIIVRVLDAYRPGYIRNLPDAVPPVNLAAIFPDDTELRSLQAAGTVPGTHWEAVELFAKKGLISTNPATNRTFRLNAIASIGEATLIFWRALSFSQQAGQSATEAFAGFRSKLQCADVNTPTAASYLIPVAQGGATSNGYGRNNDLSLFRQATRGWRTEKILTLEFFETTTSDRTGYSLSATRAILAKLGINLIKYLADHGANAANAMAAQPTSDPTCRFTSAR
jgi:hypothetical protein